MLSSPSEIKNSPKSNEKVSLIVEGINAEINDESNKNSKKITIQNDQQTKKMNLFKKNLSEQKHETPENNNFKQDLSKLNEKKSRSQIMK